MASLFTCVVPVTLSVQEDIEKQKVERKIQTKQPTEV